MWKLGYRTMARFIAVRLAPMAILTVQAADITDVGATNKLD